jgi:hypothetical protein
MRGFSAPPDLKDTVPETASMIVDALTVGARRTQAALVCTWAAFGQPPLALRLCEEASSRKGLGRQLQYAIEH